MRALLFLLWCAAAIVHCAAADVFVKQVTIAVPSSSGVRFRECKYFLDDTRAAKLPRFDPEIIDSYLPPTRALAIAFEQHFAVPDLPKARYYREVQLSLEKTDDYSESAVAKAVRSSMACGNVWFYVVSCGKPTFGNAASSKAPVLVLMDGTIIKPREEIRSRP